MGYSKKIAANMLIITLVIMGIYFLHEVLVPLMLALLLSILLSPVVLFIKYRLKFPHILAVFAALFLAILVCMGVIFFISEQISGFFKDIPTIQQHLNTHYHNMQNWVYEKFSIGYTKQNNYIAHVTEEIKDGDGMLAKPLNHFSTILITTVLVPVYTFFMLLYRNLFINFLTKMVHEKHHPILKEIICEVKAVIHSYIVGLLLEMVIVTTLVSIGLAIVGVDYPILIGVVTGILNLVPYLGIFTSTLLCVFIALGADSGIGTLLSIMVVFITTHLIDANILIPRVVSSKVKINALAAIIGIVCGGILIGIAGMFLALPIIAITKVVFDRVPGLEPWGYLLGDSVPKKFDWNTLKSGDL